MNDYEFIGDSTEVPQNPSMPSQPELLRRYRDSDRVIGRYAKTLGISRAGKDWMVAAVDPFHDTAIKTVGIPDGTNALSTTLVLNQFLTITAPTGVTGAWDCSIVDFPTSASGPKNAYVQGSSVGTGGTGPSGQMQYSSSNTPSPVGLGVIAAATGVNLDWTASSGGYPLQQNLTLPAGYGASNYRVIAKGFEVINATANITKSGTVIAWTQTSPDITTASTYVINAPGGTPSGAASFVVASAPPPNVSQAQLLVNSVMHLAEGGIYVPGRLNNVNIPTTSATTSNYLYYGVNPTTPPYVMPSPGTVANIAYMPTANQQSFNQTGAYFTGLNNSTVLSVRYRTIIEQFPTNGDVLLSTAKPSPDYDPRALEIYTRMIANMPPGVPAMCNGMGDWFKSAMSKIASLPIISTFVNAPSRINSIVKGVDKYVEKQVDKIEKGNLEEAVNDIAKFAPAIKTAKALQQLTRKPTSKARKTTGRRRN